MDKAAGSALAGAGAATVALILNDGAGSCDGFDLDATVARLRAAGFEPRVTQAKDGDAVVAAARRARDDGVPLVIAGGGDGTINAVAGQLLGSPSVLGVLPLGTLNHFAKDLGIPMAIDAAVQVVLDGHRRMVDVGEVNGRIFLNNSSIGLYPDMVREREVEQKKLAGSKWLAFAWACVRTAIRFPTIDVRIDADGRDYRRHTPFVFVGNNPYVIEGIAMGGRTSLDAGTLGVYMAQRTGRLGLLGFAVRALLGTLRQARDFDALTCTDATIALARASVEVSTDGEVTRLDAPLKYRVRPRALQVVAPGPAAGARS